MRRQEGALAALGALLVCACLQGCSDRYDEKQALLYARMSGVAYCDRASIESWNCGEYCKTFPGKHHAQTCENDTHASLAYVVKMPSGSYQSSGQTDSDGGSKHLCLVGFRGSSNFRNWQHNLYFAKADDPFKKCPGCLTHGGFLDIWHGLRPCLLDALKAEGCRKGSSLAVVGHSLGGALATLAMMDLDRQGWKIAEAYTFGSPRVGNEAFADDFAERFNGSAWRVTYRRDPFVHLPLHWQGFRHTNPEIFYDAWQEQDDGSQGAHVQCNRTDREDDDHLCANQYDWASVNSWYYNDHRHYLGISITACPGGVSVVTEEDDLPGTANLTIASEPPEPRGEVAV